MAASLSRWRGCRIAAGPLSLPQQMRAGWLLSSPARAAAATGALSTRAQHLAGGPAYPTATSGGAVVPRTPVSARQRDRAADPASSPVSQLARSSGGGSQSPPQHALPGALRSALPTVSPAPLLNLTRTRCITLRPPSTPAPPWSLAGRKPSGPKSSHSTSRRKDMSVYPMRASPDFTRHQVRHP